jgi:molybdopterin-biosynthesis enzyme MoeA-like protein
VVLRELFLKADEGAIAGSLRQTAEQYPGVLIGSYPDFFKRDYSVKITLEAHEAGEVDEATAYLRERLLALAVPIVRTT